MARVRIVAWNGHGNLGDEVLFNQMVSFLISKGHKVVEEGADWTLFGGGTLIQKQGEFFEKITDPSRTIGWGLGCAESWTNQGLELLRQMPAIFCRDDFTYEQLKFFNCNAILSFDPLLAFEGPTFKVRSGLAVNLLKPNTTNRLEYQASSKRLSEHFNRIDCSKFSLGNSEDNEYFPNAEVFDDFKTLVDWLGSFESAAVSRLHANVAAYVARVPFVTPLIYDPKIIAFYLRVAGVPQEEARREVLKHFEDLNDILIS